MLSYAIMDQVFDAPAGVRSVDVGDIGRTPSKPRDSQNGPATTVRQLGPFSTLFCGHFDMVLLILEHHHTMKIQVWSLCRKSRDNYAEYETRSIATANI